jgi:hypothetical protein
MGGSRVEGGGTTRGAPLGGAGVGTASGAGTAGIGITLGAPKQPEQDGPWHETTTGAYEIEP